MGHYSSPLNFPLSSLAKTDHVVRSHAGTICQWNVLGRLSDDSARSVEVAHQRQLSPTVFLDKMKRIYRPMSILVRREQKKYFFRLKTAVNYGTVKRQAGTEVSEVSRFEVSSLEGFFFRSQQLTYEVVYTCIDVTSSEEDTTENT